MLKNLENIVFVNHSISYAQLVLGLAYQKFIKKKFWLSTLNHCNSSYKKWVHFNEAKCAGWDLSWEKAMENKVIN